MDKGKVVGRINFSGEKAPRFMIGFDARMDMNEALKAGKYHSVLLDLAERMRSALKHGLPKEHKGCDKGIQLCRDWLFEILQDNGVDLWED